MMSRRNSLLGSLSSSSGGGDKIVNHGTITLNSAKSKITWEYPLASFLVITLSTNSGNLLVYAASGSSTNSIALGPGETIISVASIDPQEDENYIYEVVIE